MTEGKYLSEARLSESPKKKLSLVLRDGSVENSKLAKNSVDSSNIVNESITRNKVAKESISIDKLSPELQKIIESGFSGFSEETNDKIQSIYNYIKWK